ncbi:MAG: glycosyltransferase [Lachnotalea sp.]
MSESAEQLFTGERFVPGIEDVKLEIEHFQRYLSVKDLVRGKNVLDGACGEGYGSAILSETAASVIGIDIDAGAVQRASEKYNDRKNLEFMEASVADLHMIADNSLDAVISFETIEHVPIEVQNEYLEEIARILKPDGFLVMSTPNKEIYSDLYNYHNEFHIKEFYKTEFLDFLQAKFKNVQLYNQYFEVSSIIDNNASEDRVVNYFKDKEKYNFEGKYFIAIASNIELPKESISSVFMNEEKEHETIIQRIIELQNDVEERNKHLKQLDNEFEEKSRYVENLIEEIEGLKVDRSKLMEISQNQSQELCNKSAHIQQLIESERMLKQKEAEYEHIKTTYSWKLMKVIQKIGDTLLPPKSRRRFLCRVIVNIFRNPKVMIKMFSPKRIKNYFKFLRLEGMEGVQTRYKEALNLEGTRLSSNEIVLLDVQVDLKKRKFDEYETIIFEQYESPDVSIIIPIYNQFEYTYNCLESIKNNSGDVTYEIILGNDCSTDFTTRIKEKILGITVVTNEENLRFLKNCNHAASYYNGKYILFLNNDTQVQDNWLRPLVDLMEKDEMIGLTGSKLVYANGTLQEAGGIFWNDASAWNYGNRCNTQEPEYNYVKEVDYISGASIMIRSTLWNEIGGFDEQFAPAYYEDADLAFEVRKHGYKVVYQPLSVVVHFEGISNGTDTSTGQKQYQIVNKDRFFKKWKEVLEKEHFPNAENVFLAKDRSRFKKRILIVDHYVPHYDKDAGGKCTFMYTSLFAQLGYQVTFIGDNYFRHEPYTTELQQKGVEVIYGNYYYKNWKTWLKDNAKYFDYVYLNRPHIAPKYIDIIRKYSEAKIVYFGHDLHYLREYRQYLISKNPEMLKSSEEWKKKEFELFNKADVIHVVGSYEQQVIQKEVKDKPVRNIPLYIYETILEDINKDFSERQDIIFVGGFGHPPNIDAVLWFSKEIFPKILEKHPEVKWYVVGSKVTPEIQALNSEHIIIKGFVPDDELDQMYRACRMAVVPLRVGAGVKGKVVEAAYYQIPLVTTSIGGEGLSAEEGAFLMEDEGDKMAQIINELYDDYDRLNEISDNGIKFIQKYFMLSEAERILDLDF